MKIGKGWAPEPELDITSLIVIRELRILLDRIFSNLNWKSALRKK